MNRLCYRNTVRYKTLLPDPLMSIEALPTLNEADTIIVLGWNADVDEGLENSDASIDESATERLEFHQGQAIQQSWQANDIAQSLAASQENRVYFATFYQWNGLNGPIGAELILAQLRQWHGSKEADFR